MATTNDITGDKLITKPTTNEYAEGWDRIFGKTQYEQYKQVSEKDTVNNDDAKDGE